LALQWSELNQLDIITELQAHKDLTAYNQKRKTIDELNKFIARCVADEAKETKQCEKLKKEIADLEDHKCYACGQELHDSKHEEVLDSKKKALQEAALQALSTNTQYIENTDALTALGELGLQPTVFYSREEDAINHRNTIQNLEQQITARESDEDPYQEQIDELSETALQEILWDKVNDLNNLKEHQEFLLKLLTSKDSFIRKKIIDQNLAYLNNRLTFYLDKMGLPHSVTFLNDLTVEITQLGQDLDFDNLSRGERNRLILGLSWSFRDVWESLYQNINLLFIDELIDNGLDASGVESALAVLKKMARERNKNIYLISHKDELIGRVNNVLKVIKENGFTSYEHDLEVTDEQ